MNQVNVYVDGFNLFYGLRSKGWRRYYWLDIRALAVNLLRPGQTLAAVRYFTSRIFPDLRDPDKLTRQRTYLEAMTTLEDVHIHYGYFLPKQERCTRCGASFQAFEEKMTDVNIAVELLGDAQDNAFDAAVIISGDSDLTGPVNAVRARYPSRPVIVAFPPNRISKQLRQAATASFTIGRKKLQDSQLPAQVTKPDGYTLTKPPEWS